jgi:hypothetical protein
MCCATNINYTEHIKNVLRKKYIFKLRTNNYFVLTSGKEKVILFQSTFSSKKLPSEIIFAQSVLKIVILSGLRCVHQ